MSSSTVPFSRDAHFIQRNNITTQLDLILQKPDTHNRAALWGLGGIGKSQIAIEYSYLVIEKEPNTWVFWIHASDRARVEESFRSVATAINLPGHEDQNIDILMQVSLWLSNKENGSWLLVLDNANDSDVILSTEPGQGNPKCDTTGFKRPLLEYVPQMPHGRLLITSRNQQVAYDLVGNYDHVVHVNFMDDVEALGLLKTRLSIDSTTESTAKRLLRTLDHIPLAIAQAGAYIMKSDPSMMTTKKYLDLFDKNEASKVTLLNQNAKDVRRDFRMLGSVITTWEISFNQIRQKHQAAADLLSLMANFHRQGIPHFLIRGEEDGPEFLENLATLHNFSFITMQNSGDIFDMPHLVQVATRKWLETDQSIQQWKVKAMGRMVEVFPTSEFQNWNTCRLLLPHAEGVINFEDVPDEERFNLALLLNKTASYISAQGNYGLAAMRQERCLQILNQVSDDKKDSLVLSTKDQLALTYSRQGRWKEAERLQVQVLETRKSREIEADHPDILASMSNLALTYANQGRWETAQKMQVHTLETTKRVLGAEHPDTLRAMNNLAAAYGAQGRWKKAEKLQMQALEKEKRVLGAEHPQTLSIMNCLATTYCYLGLWEKAEKMALQGIEMSMRVMGAEHPTTLSSIHKLANAYRKQGHLEAAEKLEVHVFEVSKRVLGAEHPSTLSIMTNLAGTYSKARRFEEAEKLLVEVFEKRKATLSAEHPETLTSIHNLAIIYVNQARWQEAENLQLQVIEARSRVIGVEHPDTVTSIENLLRMYWHLGRYDEYIEHSEVLEQVRKVTRRS